MTIGDVQAARFGSPLDGFLTVYDADRKVIASADDVNGSPDPVVTLTLPKDGAYFIALIDAHDLGGAGNFGLSFARHEVGPAVAAGSQGRPAAGTTRRRSEEVRKPGACGRRKAQPDPGTYALRPLGICTPLEASYNR